MRKKVLLVDNDRLFVELMTEVLEDQGFQVITAYDGLEGLEKARKELPDFALVDLVMPKIDGTRLCRYLKEDPRLAHIPVLLISGAVREKWPELEEVGADAYVAKVPFNRLVEDVREALARLEPDRAPGVWKEIVLGIERTVSRTTVKELLKGEGHSRAVLEHIGDAVIKLDATGKIIYANPVALKLAEVSEVSLIGRFVGEILQLDAEPDFKRALQEVMGSRGATKQAVTLVRGERILRIVLTNVIEHGETTGVVVIVHDASRERFAQTEKLRALGVMASGMAHDFNNMLSVILGTTELLMAKVQEEWALKRMDMIRKAALDGAETVRRIQEFARARTDEPGFVPVDINQCVEDALEFTKPRWKGQAEHGAVPLRLITDLQARGLVMGNPSELREVLVNVFLNAIDAMPEGGGMVVRTQVCDGFVHITVRDTGCGITDEVRGRAFDPFFTTKGTEGSGLGLSVSYGIVTRHRGEITVEGEPGKGTTVEIRLPLAQVDQRTDEGEESQPSAKRGSILLIENNEALRKTLGEMLEMGGHEVMDFGSAGEALAAFGPGRYDAVFTNLGLPDKSGWEVAREIKARDPDMPVVLVTGWGASVSEEEARAAGIDIVASKPLEYQQFMTLVESAFSLRTARGRS